MVIPSSSCFDNVVNGTASRISGGGWSCEIDPAVGRCEGASPALPAARAFAASGNRAPTSAAGGRRRRPSRSYITHVLATTTLSCIGVSDCPLNYSVSIRLRLCRCDACLAYVSHDWLSCVNEYVCSWALLLFPRDRRRLISLTDVVLILILNVPYHYY